MGYFSGGKFNLIVSYPGFPGVDEVNYLETVFNKSSQILFDATDGQHSIGSIMLSPNYSGIGSADIIVHPSWERGDATGARLWVPCTAIDIPSSYLLFPTLIVHELGHYLYDLGDEYDAGAICMGDSATGACLMEKYDITKYSRWVSIINESIFSDYTPTFITKQKTGEAVYVAGEPSEFCYDGNHRVGPRHVHDQNARSGGRSCWSWMAEDSRHGNLPYALTMPAASPTGAPATAPPIVFSQLIPEQRFMLVLDRSGSMNGEKFEQLMTGANFWVGYVNAGEVLGITTYAGTPTADVPLTPIPVVEDTAAVWRTDTRADLGALAAGGQTAIGDALRSALDDIIAGGMAAGQVIILFSDGLQTVGAETPEEVLPDLIAAHVRVYTIGVGFDQNALMLSQLSTATGGKYFGIDSALPADSVADAISDALILIAGEARDGSGISSFDYIDSAPDASIHTSLHPQPFNWKKEKKQAENLLNTSFKFKVNVSPGSENCTLGVKWNIPERNFEVSIVSPAGHIMNDSPGVRKVVRGGSYVYYVIDEPLSGEWTVVVSGPGANVTRFRTIGFEVNKDIRLEVITPGTQVKPGEPIQLKAQLFYKYPLAGVELTAAICTPTGKWHTVPFHENTGKQGEKEKRCVYSVEIPTDQGLEGQYLVYVRAHTTKGTQVLPIDEAHRKEDGQAEIVLDVPEIHREKAVLIVASNTEGKIKTPHGYNNKPVYVDPDQEDKLKEWKKTHQQNTTITE